MRRFNNDIKFHAIGRRLEQRQYQRGNSKQFRRGERRFGGNANDYLYFGYGMLDHPAGFR
jgi:hypothetical protein